MKFYEVQPALESGKKIRRKSMNENSIGISLSKCLRNVYVEVFADESESIWEMNSHDLRADDWEIVDNLPQRVIESDIISYIKCPTCGKRVIASFNSTSCRCSCCEQETKIIKSPVYITVPFAVGVRGIHLVGGSEHETTIEIAGE